ncbi:MAG: hypothetical protein KDB27_04775 [Planctomycetales bacterium]|nr:hypothetical protein [Planctomycetales bacterium]
MHSESDSPINPYAPPTEAADGIVVKPDSGGAGLKRLCIAQMIIIILALLAQMWEIETIVISGFVFSLIGLSITIVAYRRSRPYAVIAGGSAVGYALLLIVVINLNKWSPADAEYPVRIMSSLYSAAFVPLLAYCARGTPSPSLDR